MFNAKLDERDSRKILPLSIKPLQIQHSVKAQISSKRTFFPKDYFRKLFFFNKKLRKTQFFVPGQVNG